MLITLSCGTKAIIDDDMRYLARWVWRLSTKGYVVRNGSINGRKVTFRLHREVMKGQLQPGDEVDHEDRNKLDCRRSNLRVVSRSVNQKNKPAMKRKNGGTLKGANWSKARGCWIAQINIGTGKTRYLGGFATQEEAHAAWCAAAKMRDGEDFRAK